MEDMDENNDGKISLTEYVGEFADDDDMDNDGEDDKGTISIYVFYYFLGRFSKSIRYRLAVVCTICALRA